MRPISLYLYRIVSYLLVPVALVRFLIRSLTRREYRCRLSERVGVVPSHVQAGSIWVHAVSVGEVNAVRPLVEHLLDAHHVPVLLSCVTPTGSAQIQRLFGNRVSQIYAPIDAGFIVDRTLRLVKPCLLLIAETELWPNLLHISYARNVPVAFVNLRLSDRTFRRAQYFRSLCQYSLKEVSSFCVQTSTDAERIIALGAPRERVHVTGNLKFDVSPPENIQEVAAALRNRWGGAACPTIVLGSSHEGEEVPFIKVVLELRVNFPKLISLIVPRHPERFDRVFQQISGCGLTVIRYSQWQAGEASAVDVILVDSMGQLLEFYAASDVAVVGGSFTTVGGHNILEPIMVGTPAVFGPDMANFREISRLVLESAAGEMVENFDELKDTLSRYLVDLEIKQMRVRNGERLLKRNRGALLRTVDALKRVPEWQGTFNPKSSECSL